MYDSVSQLGIVPEIALPSNTKVVKDESYILLNLTNTMLAMPDWQKEQRPILSDFGREGCYYFLLGDEANSSVVRRLWNEGKVAIFKSDEFPSYEVDSRLVGKGEDNPYLNTGFDKKDFQLAQAVGEDHTSTRTHVVDPKKTTAKLNQEFNYKYYKQYNEVPPMAKKYNSEAFDQNGNFDTDEWVRNAKRGKEDIH